MLNIIHIKEEGEEMDKVIEDSMAIINLYPEIFPHMYKQGFRLIKRIKNGNLILQDGVVITFHQYSGSTPVTRNSRTKAKPKAFIIHQIASDRKVVGATKKVLDEFVTYCKSKGAPNILLTVRSFNSRARIFYERYGFKFVEETHWTSKADGIIPGVVYRYPLQTIKTEQFFKY